MNELMNEGLHFAALGGAEKVGMNMYAYMVDGRIIVVDCGYDFLNDDFPGIELGFADASFLENNREYMTLCLLPTRTKTTLAPSPMSGRG